VRHSCLAHWNLFAIFLEQKKKIIRQNPSNASDAISQTLSQTSSAVGAVLS